MYIYIPSCVSMGKVEEVKGKPCINRIERKYVSFSKFIACIESNAFHATFQYSGYINVSILIPYMITKIMSSYCHGMKSWK